MLLFARLHRWLSLVYHDGSCSVAPEGHYSLNEVRRTRKYLLLFSAVSFVSYWQETLWDFSTREHAPRAKGIFLTMPRRASSRRKFRVPFPLFFYLTLGERSARKKFSASPVDYQRGMWQAFPEYSCPFEFFDASDGSRRLVLRENVPKILSSRKIFL